MFGIGPLLGHDRSPPDSPREEAKTQAHRVLWGHGVVIPEKESWGVEGATRNKGHRYWEQGCY